MDEGKYNSGVFHVTDVIFSPAATFHFCSTVTGCTVAGHTTVILDGFEVTSADAGGLENDSRIFLLL
jgi:hypothetical protein